MNVRVFTKVRLWIRRHQVVPEEEVYKVSSTTVDFELRSCYSKASMHYQIQDAWKSCSIYESKAS
jgi:hypothetical protein